MEVCYGNESHNEGTLTPQPPQHTSLICTCVAIRRCYTGKMSWELISH